MSRFSKSFPILSALKPQDYIPGLPKEYYDDEWHANQREKTKDLERLPASGGENYVNEELRKAKKIGFELRKIR